jgi:hypothetical protein
LKGWSGVEWKVPILGSFSRGDKMNNEKPTTDTEREAERAARYLKLADLIEKWATEDPAYDEAVGEALEQLDRELEEESRQRREHRDESAA